MKGPHIATRGQRRSRHIPELPPQALSVVGTCEGYPERVDPNPNRSNPVVGHAPVKVNPSVRVNLASLPL